MVGNGKGKKPNCQRQKCFLQYRLAFNEFPNATAHAMYVTCAELLNLPLAPKIVADNVIDVVLKVYVLISSRETHNYINAISIVLAELPDTYWSVVYEGLQEVLNLPRMLRWTYRFNVFELLNFRTVRQTMVDKTYAAILAVTHSVFHHMGCFKLVTITKYIKEKLKPCVHTESQLVFLYHVFGPFLQHIEQEKPNAVTGIAILLYEMLEVVDKHDGPTPLEYMDPICDLLYHIKYIHVGNIIKNESEAIIKRLRPVLQKCLRFVTYLNIKDKHNEKPNEIQHTPATNVNNITSCNQFPVTQSFPI
uniref:Mediator of RNA polymerase II transcription subunit 23 n=1 Tax=Glossina morsitans morsitans TaxID=37546 RepID=A0A1B0GBY7_GLOMM